jgi:hypothetical protein
MESMDNFRERVEALEQQMKVMGAHTRTVERRLRWWRGMASGVLMLGLLSWALPSGKAQAPTLEQRVAALEQKLVAVTFGSTNNELVITGANLRIVNGLGNTDTTNGLGNLIVGYNEPRTDPTFPPDVRTGSHNVVVGRQHNFSSFGGLVVAQFNEISGPWASVSGGQHNTASSLNASVSGGVFGTASGESASVSGGNGNTASGVASWVSGGQFNTAGGNFFSSVSGGALNTASGDNASVCGGGGNTASGNGASVCGGGDSTASGDGASVSGGQFNTASGLNSSVSGGEHNTASGDFSSVSGGKNRSAPGTDNWAAGALRQPN